MSIRLPIAAAVAFLMGAVVAVQAANTITIAQRGLMLAKSAIEIARGDRVIFTNEDDVIHNIHIFGPADYEKDLGLQKPGVPLNYTFDSAGLFKIRCNIHPSVKMAVTVR